MTAHLRTFFKHKQSLAVGAVFISMGFLYGNWATLIPAIKQRFDLNDAQLGLLLLCMPFGSTVTNPLATVLIHRFGLRFTTVFGMFFLAFAFITPFYSNNLPLTAMALVLVGASEAITNIAMNTCVTSIETNDNINIMATSHALFSMGLMLGSVLASVLIGAQLSPFKQSLVFSSIILLLAIVVKSEIYKIPEEQNLTDNAPVGSTFILPKGALLLMIAISLCTNVMEGAMADWAAVYMSDIVQAPTFYLGWGLASYSLFMALGRFMGDSIIPKFGANFILQSGGLLTAFGILLFVLIPNTPIAIIGFACVGMGVSCAAPILYGSAARLPNMARGAGLATMNTFSIAGFLIGPVIIGFISKASSLPMAMSIVAALGLLWAFLTKRVRLY